MFHRKYEIGIIGITTLFILANAYLTTKNIFLLNGLPVLLLALVLLLFSVRQLFFLLVFLVPLSIPLYRLVSGLSFDFWVPTEPIIFSVLVILILKSIKEKYFDKDLVNHPVFWSMLFYLGWIAISIVPSELPLVSAKYLLVRIWFIGVFFYLGFILFKSNPKYFKYFLASFITGLFIVSSITLIKHLGLGIFNQKAAHGACTPFFIDHTSYGATIAFVIPVLFSLIVLSRSLISKISFSLLLTYFTFALIFSYSRAAWLSVVVAAAIWFVWFLRIRFSILLTSFIIVVVLLVSFQFEINRWLSSNTTDSSGNLKEHLNSAMNVTTDASNLERINRWSAALRMFEERPVFGWGPGTYMFYYASFQRSYQKTIISTNFGTGGNAHSEYLGLLADSGFLAMLGYVLILVFVFYRGFAISRKIENRQYRILLIGSLLGLVTYTVHGFMNDFLDSDKIAAPFWGFIAFIVAVDIKIRNKESLLDELEAKD
ncbi:MAG: O-antigen ligase family protein [Tenuifilaceae bacterium]